MTRGQGIGNTAHLFGRLRTLCSRNTPKLGDRGAVAVEFALIAPVMLLLCLGIFGVGVVMVQQMQLYFAVENAAWVEAANPGQGLAKAFIANQLGSSVSVNANPSASCGVGFSGQQVTGLWPVTMGILDAVTLTLSATATGCWPTK